MIPSFLRRKKMQTWSDRIITAPTTQAITTAQAKEFLRLNHDDDDRFIDLLISVAAAEIETFTSYSLGVQTRLFTQDSAPDADYFEIPRRQVTAVSWVKYYNTEGSLTTFDAANYQSDFYTRPPRVALVSGASWPSLQTGKLGAFQCQYVSGSADTPNQIQLAILFIVARMYWGRNPDITISDVSQAERLVMDFKLWL